MISDRSLDVLLNIRSLLNKTHDVLEMISDRSLDVLCLVEAWHDADSVFMRRLSEQTAIRSSNVHARARLLPPDRSLSTMAASPSWLSRPFV